MLKTHSCGLIRAEHIGEKVTLAGWVHRRRDHGGLIFIDLRDREGLVQVVFNPAESAEAHRVANEARSEYVLRVVGEVGRRPAGTENAQLPTGEIEVLAREAQLLNRSKTPPFYINEEVEVEENLRLKYRYLDLRRFRMKDNIILRARVVRLIRDFLDARGFLEIETPILLKSTPEGARDYLVPSRLYPGQFYALPQSPQQLKQLLMVAGFEKYYQIARCFRDEDQRADRQPEFTQLDLEMSFVEEEDILRLMEELFTTMVETLTPSKRVVKPFPRLSYAECMARYGTDKPDLRFGLEMSDLSDAVQGTDFGIFRSALGAGGQVKGFAAPGCASYSRRELEDLTALARSYGAKGLVTMALGPLELGQALTPEAVRSAVAKFLSPGQLQGMIERLRAKADDLLLIMAGKAEEINPPLSQLRMEMGRRLSLADPNLMAFGFVLNFPLFEWDSQAGHWSPMHHPFTAPCEEDLPLLEADPKKVRARHYDLICNGAEISSGSIRIHTRELQERVFKLLGYKAEQVEELFGHLLEAFDYGAPPHGGIAPGIDRLVMLLAGEQTIREVIPFPKNQAAMDPMTGSPSPVSEEQLRELHLSLRQEGP